MVCNSYTETTTKNAFCAAENGSGTRFSCDLFACMPGIRSPDIQRRRNHSVSAIFTKWSQSSNRRNSKFKKAAIPFSAIPVLSLWSVTATPRPQLKMLSAPQETGAALGFLATFRMFAGHKKPRYPAQGNWRNIDVPLWATSPAPHMS